MTIETKRLLDRAEAAKRGDLSEIEIRRLLAEIEGACNAAVQRRDDLGMNGLTGKPMPGRAAAMEKGAAAVVAADHEQQQIDAAIEILEHCRITAEEAVKAARKREADPKAAAAIKALPKAVTALAKAKSAYAKARNEAENLVTEITTARHAGGTGSPALSDKGFEELAAALFRDPVERNATKGAERAARVNLTGEAEQPEQPREPWQFRGFRGGTKRRLA